MFQAGHVDKINYLNLFNIRLQCDHENLSLGGLLPRTSVYVCAFACYQCTLRCDIMCVSGNGINFASDRGLTFVEAGDRLSVSSSSYFIV